MSHRHHPSAQHACWLCDLWALLDIAIATGMLLALVLLAAYA